MAKWSFNEADLTPIAVADAIAMTSNSYMALMGGSATQVLSLNKLYMGGEATTSSPSLMVLSRDSTVHITPTALPAGASNAAGDTATAPLAAPPVALEAASTNPQRSATLHLLPVAFNAFGGVVYLDLEELGFRTLGNTASFGEISLSAYTGGTPGTMAVFLIYEPLAHAELRDADLGDRAGRTHRRHRSRGESSSQLRRSHEWRGII